MSNEKQETVADIVREMRTLGQLDEESTDKIPLSLQALGLRTYADRIEAAVNQPVTNCNHLGNVAEMREALEFAEDELWSHGLFDASKRIASALSAPPRNCDRFSNANEALEAFENEKRETIIEFIRWLFADFAEAKGGVK